MWISNIIEKKIPKLHELAVYDGEKFQCEYKATQKRSLVTHQKSLHMSQKFQCPACEYQATRKFNLVTHQQSVHMS